MKNRITIEPRTYDDKGRFELAETEQAANCFALILDNEEAIFWCDTLKDANAIAPEFEEGLRVPQSTPPRPSKRFPVIIDDETVSYEDTPDKAIKEAARISLDLKIADIANGVEETSTGFDSPPAGVDANSPSFKHYMAIKNVSNDDLCRSEFYKQLVDLYLDYVNNWLTINRFSEHHGLPPKDMQNLLKIGEELHLENVKVNRIIAREKLKIKVTSGVAFDQAMIRAEKEGWCIAYAPDSVQNENGLSPYQLQRIDETQHFASDWMAWQYVNSQAEQGCLTSLVGLVYLYRNSRPEFLRVRAAGICLLTTC